MSATRINMHWQPGAGLAACPTAPTTGYASVVAGDHALDYCRLGESSGQAAVDYSGNCRVGAYAFGNGHVTGLLTNDSDRAVSSPTPLTTIVNASADGLPAGNSARTIEF